MAWSFQVTNESIDNSCLVIALTPRNELVFGFLHKSTNYSALIPNENPNGIENFVRIRDDNFERYPPTPAFVSTVIFWFGGRYL